MAKSDSKGEVKQPEEKAETATTETKEEVEETDDTEDSQELGSVPENPFTTWDEVWKAARKHKFTHYNWARGHIRFRGIEDDPQEIGMPLATVKPGELIHIRFYIEDDKQYIEFDDYDVYLRIPDEYQLSLPTEFEGFSPGQQTAYIIAQMHKASATRWQRQAQTAERMIYTHIEYLHAQGAKKDARIAELERKLEEANANRGVNNIWDFLVHPNSGKALEGIGNLVGQFRGDPSEGNQQRMISWIQDNAPMVRRALDAAPSTDKK